MPNVPRSSQSRQRKSFIVLDSDDEYGIVTQPKREIKASGAYTLDDLHAEPSAINANLYAGKWYKRGQIHLVLGGNQQRVISK